ncbi:MAG: OmpH family outer membrane protein [Oceanipulchritudo sp.]
MRNVKRLLLPVLAMGTLFFNAASAELTVVTVSMQKLFDGYYKSAEANQRLESIREQAVSEAQEKEKELQGMAEKIRTMQEELQNPVLSDESKEEKQAELQQIAQEGQQKQAEFQQWQQQTMNNLNQRGQEIRRTLIEEIVKVVNELALKDYSADLVFDTSDILGSGVPTVLYATDDLDITDKVLIKLNADAPNN